MKKLHKSFISCICITAALAVSGIATVWADTSIQPADIIRIHGPITKTENQSLVMDNQSNTSSFGNIVLNISDKTRILDATTGYPVPFENLRDGESAYAYISSVMTMSLPPITNSSLILCNIPAGFRVPEYLQTDSLTIHADGISGSVTATNGNTYTIPADCQIIPYLTRNIATIHDLGNGRTFLLWADSQNNVTKIMVFPGEANTDLLKTGWVQENNLWYYYGSEGVFSTGWLQDNDDWYYLDPNNGVMQTGFISLEGRTYYLQENGKMLTKAKTFTPDANGALH